MLDKARFEDLLAEEEWVRKRIRKWVRDEASVDDVIQELWVVCLTTPPSAAQPAKFWMLTVAWRLVVSRHRQDTSRKRREKKLVPCEKPLDPKELASFDSVCEVLNQAISELSPAYRTVIRLYYFEQESCRSIALRLELHADNVRKRLIRGREQLASVLRKRFGREYEEWIASSFLFLSTTLPRERKHQLSARPIRQRWLAVVLGTVSVFPLGELALSSEESCRVPFKGLTLDGDFNSVDVGASLQGEVSNVRTILESDECVSARGDESDVTDPTEEELYLTFETQIVDPNGWGIPNAVVKLYAWSGDCYRLDSEGLFATLWPSSCPQHDETRAAAQAIANERGFVSLRIDLRVARRLGWTEGPFGMIVQAPGFVSRRMSSQGVFYRKGREASSQILLRPSARLVGRVSTQEGLPIPDARIVVEEAINDVPVSISIPKFTGLRAGSPGIGRPTRVERRVETKKLDGVLWSTWDNTPAANLRAFGDFAHNYCCSSDSQGKFELSCYLPESRVVLLSIMVVTHEGEHHVFRDKVLVGPSTRVKTVNLILESTQDSSGE